MTKNKLVTVFLIMLLTVTLITGCSLEEQEFLTLQKEISELTLYESSGEMVFSLQGLPVPSTNDPAEVLLFNVLQKGIKINYTGKADLEKGTIEYTYSYVNDTLGTEQVLTKVIGQGNIMYIKIDELVNFFKTLGDTEISKELQEVFGDTEYLSMTIEEYYESLGVTQQDQPLAMLYPDSFTDNDLNKLLQKLMLTFPEAYQNYSTGLLQKSGNTYSWQVSGGDAVRFLRTFLEYTLNNLPALQNWLDSFINNLSNEEMTLLGLEPQQKAEYQMLLNMMFTELTPNKEQYLQELNALMTELEQDQETQTLLEGFKLTYNLTKNGTNAYSCDYVFNMNFKDAANEVGLQMAINTEIAPTAPWNLTLPTSGVMTYTELLNKITKTMKIQIDSKTYTLDDVTSNTQANMNIQNIENQTYLPMRQIAELFGEEVGWDGTNSQAYVLKNGEKIDMTGIIIDGSTYIKTRDFTKLGYKVDWDNATRTVIINTQTL